MRENGGDIRFACLEVETLAKRQSSFTFFFITQLGHRHCLQTILFILYIYLWWLSMYCGGSFTITWSLNVLIKYITLPCRLVKIVLSI